MSRHKPFPNTPDFWLDHHGKRSKTINHNLKYWLNLATDPYVVLREVDNDRNDVKGKSGPKSARKKSADATGGFFRA